MIIMIINNNNYSDNNITITNTKNNVDHSENNKCIYKTHNDNIQMTNYYMLISTASVGLSVASAKCYVETTR